MKLTRTAERSSLSPKTISARTFPLRESLSTVVPSLCAIKTLVQITKFNLNYSQTTGISTVTSNWYSLQNPVTSHLKNTPVTGLDFPAWLDTPIGKASCPIGTHRRNLELEMIKYLIKEEPKKYGT